MIKKILKSYDYSLIVTYIILITFGLIMVYSSSMIVAIQKFGYTADHFYKKQALSIMISLIVFVFFAIFPYKAYKNKKFLMFITFSSVIGLALLYFVGHTFNNAQSWFQVGARSIQPSEFVKIAVIIYLSAVYSYKQSYIDQINKAIVPPTIFLVIVTILIMEQPDKGTAFITFCIGLMIILCSGMNWKTILKLSLISILMVFLIAPILIFNGYKLFSANNLSRIEAFLDPFANTSESGYQLINSYYAIAGGGIKGLGLGQSIQKLGYLPEGYTDFIMAVISEELGLFGVTLVIGGISYIVLRGIRTAVKCKDPFGSMLAIGISGMIGIQAIINLSALTGLIPVTGVTLPFISYGGSSILVLSIAMGILVNVSMFKNYEIKYSQK